MTEVRSEASAISAPELSVSARDVHVRYEVYEDRQLDAMMLARQGFRSRRSITVHALRGVDVDVHVGEAVGVVGANGSGKSTLLRCIAGVQPIERGRVLVRGEAQLLGVGAALQPKLSGWRNVWLGGLAMGMTREEVAEKIEAVKRFSELGNAFERPINTYSSGMKARLAFSIATMRTPDVLLIDEALAVGDRRFRRRSLRRIRDICSAAKTVMMVTHNLNEIRETCSRVIWIHDGIVMMDGTTDDVLDEYAEFESSED